MGAFPKSAAFEQSDPAVDMISAQHPSELRFVLREALIMQYARIDKNTVLCLRREIGDAARVAVDTVASEPLGAIIHFCMPFACLVTQPQVEGYLYGERKLVEVDRRPSDKRRGPHVYADPDQTKQRQRIVFALG